MSNRVGLIRKADAARLLKAARESGYKRARVIAHPDGKIEVIADDVSEDGSSASSEWDEVLH
jgi:tRNA(Phe) wybutosine-synthesizing methylase Tyw3